MAAVVLMIVVLVSIATVQTVAATGQIDVASVVSSPFGKFKGVRFVKYVGRFVGVTSAGDYEAPFEIVAPVDPRRGNGRLLVEPFHFVSGAGARNLWLTPAFLFERRFSHAGICWQEPTVDAPPEHPCHAFRGRSEDTLAIIVDFVHTLQRGDAAEFIGDVEALYSIGFSNSTIPILQLLYSPIGMGRGLFDLSIPMTSGWFRAEHAPPEGVGRVLWFNTEADVILFNPLQGAIPRSLLRDRSVSFSFRYPVACCGVVHCGAFTRRPHPPNIPHV
jgi:hypothetical protein